MSWLWKNRDMLELIRLCVKDAYTIPFTAQITSPYGRRGYGCQQGCKRMHWGTDIQWGGAGGAADHPMRDTVLQSPFGGMVLEVKPGEGKVTIVDSHGRFIIFRHMDRISVTEGQMVRRGTSLGHVGNVAVRSQNGRPGAVHIHVEVGFIVSGDRFRIWNPRDWIRESDKLGYPDFDSGLDTNLTNIYKPSPCICPKDKAKKSEKQARRVDPLIVNLDGNGIRTLGLAAGIYFDHDGNGFKELSGWAAPGNGVLFVDRNGNGSPDNGNELFGDLTLLSSGMPASNGFEALAQYDSNVDGKIDASDPIWSQLRIWHYEEWYGEPIFDAPDECGIMSTLDELGISAIHLGSTISNETDEAGNTEMRSGYFEWSDGRTGTIAEYRLQRDTMDTVEAEFHQVPEEVSLLLPDLQGFGNVPSLHQSVAQDSLGELKALVEAFASEESPANRATILDQIIFKWTGTDTVAPDARGPFMDGRKVVALEKFYGDTPANPGADLAIEWNETYRFLFEIFYASLMAETHLADLYNKFVETWDEDAQDYRLDPTDVITSLKESLANDPQEGKELLSEFARSRRGMG